MLEIKPFRAVYYNQEKVGDLSRVVCPPYDVISPQQQEDYYNESEYNFIRIMLGKETPEDDRGNNKYTRAKKTFEQWLREGILKEDDRPCIYCYQEEYTILGEKYHRLGVISLMKLQEGKDSKIFPHENTHSKAREDRFKLWRTLSSNLSSIFVCFSDREKKIDQILRRDVMGQEPFINIVDKDGVRHMLWRLEDPKLIQRVVDILSNQQLFIADGHHRYEVAQQYQKSKLSGVENSNGQEPCNYVMTYFTNMDSKSLKIFPVHRVVKDFPEDVSFLEELFRIDKIKSKEELALFLARAGRNEHAFGLYLKGGMRLLRLKNKLLIDKHITEGSKAYRRLDATILKYFVLDRVGVKSEDIIYTKDLNEATSYVDQGRARATFIMNPVKVQELREIALNGERMPPKTTYFYPKVLSGLTVYKMAP